MRIDIKKAAQILRENDDFYILSHANPDGDTLGCGFGLCRILQKMGKRAKPLCSDEIAKRMSFLAEGVCIQEFEPKTIVSVDVADKKLLGELEEKYGDKVLLAIDHHESNREFAEFTMVDGKAAAACELIYAISVELGVLLDGDIAKCLYTGIATDTGCFRFANTTPKTHAIAGKLMEYPFDYAGINYMLFDMKSRGRIQLEQEVLNGMEMFSDGRIAVVAITLEMMEKSAGKVDGEDYNGLAGLPRQIEGVLIGVTIKQKAELVFKVSMRSVEPLNVADICTVFGGGGHARAAGCTINGTLETVKEKLLPVLQSAVSQIDKG